MTTIAINAELTKRIDKFRPEVKAGRISRPEVIAMAMDALEHPPTVITKIPGEGVEITEQKK